MTESNSPIELTEADVAQFAGDTQYESDHLNAWDDYGYGDAGEGNSSGTAWQPTTTADYCAVCNAPIHPSWPSLRVIHRTGGMGFGEETACGCRVHDTVACTQTRITACLCTPNPTGPGIRLVFKP